MWDVAIPILLVFGLLIGWTVHQAAPLPILPMPLTANLSEPLAIAPAEHIGADEDWSQKLHDWNTDEHPVLGLDPEPELIPDPATQAWLRKVKWWVELGLEEPPTPMDTVMFDEDRYAEILAGCPVLELVGAR